MMYNTNNVYSSDGLILSVIVISFLTAGNSIFGLSAASPNSTESSVQQPKVPVKTHEYTLIAEDTTIEIATGIRVDAWTYNGTVPGPTLTATEGDRVIIHFVNKGLLPHTVHFMEITQVNRTVSLNRLHPMEHTLMMLLQHPLVL